MFIPFVPKAKKIVNKTVLYYDSLLSTSVETVVITKVENVSSYIYRNAINKICESNPAVLFYTIQFSASLNMLIFYTDSEISLDGYLSWLEGEKKHQNSNSFVNLFEQVLNEPVANISLLSLRNALIKYVRGFNGRVKDLERAITDRWNDIESNRRVDVHFDSMEDGHLTLRISYNVFDYKHIKLFICKNNNGKIYLKSVLRATCLFDANDFFNVAFDEIETLYNLAEDFMAIKDLIPRSIIFKNGLEAIIGVGNKYVFIEVKNSHNLDSEKISSEDYQFKCQNFEHIFLQKVQGKEEKFFSRLAVAEEDIRDIAFMIESPKNFKTGFVSRIIKRFK